MARKSFGAGLDALISSAERPHKTRPRKETQLKDQLLDKIKAKQTKASISKSSKKEGGVGNSPKWSKLQPINLRLREENKTFLDSLSFKIMKNRNKTNSPNRERITSNTIMRSLTSLLMEKSDLCNFDDIENEEALTKRLIDSLTK